MYDKYDVSGLTLEEACVTITMFEGADVEAVMSNKMRIAAAFTKIVLTKEDDVTPEVWKLLLPMKAQLLALVQPGMETMHQLHPTEIVQ